MDLVYEGGGNQCVCGWLCLYGVANQYVRDWLCVYGVANQYVRDWLCVYGVASWCQRVVFWSVALFASNTTSSCRMDWWASSRRSSSRHTPTVIIWYRAQCLPLTLSHVMQFAKSKHEVYMESCSRAMSHVPARTAWYSMKLTNMCHAAYLPGLPGT